jgi:hypothetical protein
MPEHFFPAATGAAGMKHDFLGSLLTGAGVLGVRGEGPKQPQGAILQYVYVFRCIFMTFPRLNCATGHCCVIQPTSPPSAPH